MARRNRPTSGFDIAMLEAEPQISVMTWTAPLFVVSGLCLAFAIAFFYDCKMLAIEYTFYNDPSEPGWPVKMMLVFSILLFFFSLGLNFNFGVCPLCLQLATHHSRLRGIVYILQSSCWKVYYWLYWFCLLLPVAVLGAFWIAMASRVRNNYPETAFEGAENYCAPALWHFSKVLWIGFWIYSTLFLLRLSGVNVGLIGKIIGVNLWRLIKKIFVGLFEMVNNMVTLPEHRQLPRSIRRKENQDVEQGLKDDYEELGEEDDESEWEGLKEEEEDDDDEEEDEEEEEEEEDEQEEEEEGEEEGHEEEEEEEDEQEEEEEGEEEGHEEEEKEDDEQEEEGEEEGDE